MGDADEGRRGAAHPVLAPRHPAGARARDHDPARTPRHVQGRHPGQARSRVEVPVPGGAGRRGASRPRSQAPSSSSASRCASRSRTSASSSPGAPRGCGWSLASSPPGTRTGSPATPALPLNLNPYLDQFLEPVLAAGAVRPAAGSYDVVFDSPGRKGAGAFTFRYWLNDVTRPSASLLTRACACGTDRARPRVRHRLGRRSRHARRHLRRQAYEATLRSGVVSVTTKGLRPGRHVLRLQVSDYQESRNMENVPPILPNTRVLRTTIVVTPRRRGGADAGSAGQPARSARGFALLDRR